MSTTTLSLLNLSRTLTSYSESRPMDTTQQERELALLKLADQGNSMRWDPQPVDAMAILDFLSDDLDGRVEPTTDAIEGAIL